jgi:predicted phage terminase large subunit-like protein
MSKHLKCSPNEFLNLVKNTYDFYSKIATVDVGVENVAYQKFFGEEIFRRFSIPPIYIPRNQDKRSRILGLLVYFQNNQITFYDVEKHQDLIQELVDFPFGEHDDLIDALEMAVVLIRERLNYHKDEVLIEGEKSIIERILERVQKQDEGEITI